MHAGNAARLVEFSNRLTHSPTSSEGKNVLRKENTFQMKTTIATVLAILLLSISVRAEWSTSHDVTVWVKYASTRRTFTWSGRTDGEGKADGRGTFTVYFDREKVATYVGEMQHGQLNGQVSATYHKTGMHYEGELRDWDENGEGIMTYADETRKSGRWVDGKLAEPADIGPVTSRMPPSPVADQPQVSPPSPTTARYKAAVAESRGGSTDLHSGKGREFPVTGSIADGAVFYTIPSSEAWWRVTFQDGRSGYMSKGAITVVGRGPGPTPADMAADAQPTDAKEQNALGLKFRYGTGVPSNDELAARWFKKAADQGNLSAKANLALAYFFAQGVEKDWDLAYKLVDEGVKKGNARAQAAYAACRLNMLHNNEGPSSHNLAILKNAAYFLDQAAAQGGEDGARANVVLIRLRNIILGAAFGTLIPHIERAWDNINREPNYTWGGVPVSGDEWHRRQAIEDKRNGR